MSTTKDDGHERASRREAANAGQPDGEQVRDANEDAGTFGTAGSAPEFQAELEALRTEAEQARLRLARARADYDNLQKRVTREAGLERERAKARVLEGLLPLNELCQMASRQAQAHPPGPDAHGLVEGLVLLAREFQRLLEREGLEPIGAPGDAFDGTLHEAVAQEAADGVEPGRVSRVVQQGYKLGDKVLRFAKVAVAPK